MEINGYQLTSLAFMAAGGPLWHATGTNGQHVLVTLRAPEVGVALEARWRGWARITSPHVVALLDVARHEDGRWAIVMERVEGDTLEALMAIGALRTRGQRGLVVEGLGRGLEDLHAAGLVHGDVSPANVIVRPDGSAVLVDVLDGSEGEEGTPGWEAGTPGPQGDLESLGRISAALGLAPVARQDGSVARGPSLAGVPDLAAHPPVPVGPDEVGSAILRSVGLSEETRRRDAPPRHRRPRGRGRALGSVLVLLAAGLAMGALPLRAFLSTADAGAVSGRGVVDPCPSDAEVRDAFTSLVAARDAAVESADEDALGTASHTELAGADLAVLRLLAASGTTVHGLGTEVGPVEGATCGEERVYFVTSLTQLPHRRCAAGRCRDVSGGEARRVEVAMSRDPWRVVSVEDME